MESCAEVDGELPEADGFSAHGQAESSELQDDAGIQGQAGGAVILYPGPFPGRVLPADGPPAESCSGVAFEPVGTLQPGAAGEAKPTDGALAGGPDDTEVGAAVAQAVIGGED